MKLPVSEAPWFSVAVSQAAAQAVAAHRQTHCVVLTSVVTVTSSCQHHLSIYEDSSSTSQRIYATES